MAGVRRGEEQNGIGDLLRAGDFTQRDAELKLLAEAADPLLLCIVADPQGALHIGIGGARRHQITAHPAARQLKAYGQRRAFQRRLRGAIALMPMRGVCAASEATVTIAPPRWRRNWAIVC